MGVLPIKAWLWPNPWVSLEVWLIISIVHTLIIQIWCEVKPVYKECNGCCLILANADSRNPRILNKIMNISYIYLRVLDQRPPICSDYPNVPPLQWGIIVLTLVIQDLYIWEIWSIWMWGCTPICCPTGMCHVRGCRVDSGGQNSLVGLGCVFVKCPLSRCDFQICP